MAGQYRFKDQSGNIVAQISASVEGAIAFSGSVVDFTQANNVILGNVQLAGTASNALLLDGFDSQAFAFTSSIHPFTASIAGTNAFTSSATARLNSIETISASNVSRLNSLEIKTGSLATTGSNTFIGTQTITGSLYISSDLIVQGSSSLQNITASAVSIGTNIINLNTANPAIRYAGLSIGDSGSIGSSGSFLYDSVQDEMIFVHRGANTTVTSSVVLMGPQTFDNIGSETYPTNNRIQKGTGNEHLVDSCIIDDGTTVCVNANLRGSSTISGTSLRSNGVGTFGFNTANTGEFQIYGTALDGMIMAGRGSSNDMVITNKNGSDVFRIPTGTLNSTFLGNITAANESTFAGTSVNSRILVTANGVANTVLGFNNSGNTATGVINNAGYVGILQSYPLVFAIADIERMRITSGGSVILQSSLGICNGGVINMTIPNGNNGGAIRMACCTGANEGDMYLTGGGGVGILIAGSGKIGIGTTTPQSTLHIGPSLNSMPAATSIAVPGDTSIRFMAGSDGNANYGSFIAGTQVSGVRALSLGSRQGEGDIVTMTLTQGNVGIGAISPNAPLHICNTCTITNMSIQNVNCGGYALYQAKSACTAYTWQWGSWNDGTYRIGQSGVGDYITIATTGTACFSNSPSGIMGLGTKVHEGTYNVYTGPSCVLTLPINYGSASSVYLFGTLLGNDSMHYAHMMYYYRNDFSGFQGSVINQMSCYNVSTAGQRYTFSIVDPGGTGKSGCPLQINITCAAGPGVGAGSYYTRFKIVVYNI